MMRLEKVRLDGYRTIETTQCFCGLIEPDKHRSSIRISFKIIRLEGDCRIITLECRGITLHRYENATPIVVTRRASRIYGKGTIIRFESIPRESEPMQTKAKAEHELSRDTLGMRKNALVRLHGLEVITQRCKRTTSMVRGGGPIRRQFEGPVEREFRVFIC